MDWWSGELVNWCHEQDNRYYTVTSGILMSWNRGCSHIFLVWALRLNLIKHVICFGSIETTLNQKFELLQIRNSKLKNSLILFSEVGGWFLIPSYHKRHLQQINWNKIFCRMYGLVVMLIIPTPKLLTSVIQVRMDQGLAVKIRCPMRSW